jgi:hypothetical protein
MSKTTILLETETRRLLQDRAKKSQTYDEFIRALVAKCDECECEGKEKKRGLDAD